MPLALLPDFPTWVPFEETSASLQEVDHGYSSSFEPVIVPFPLFLVSRDILIFFNCTNQPLVVIELETIFTSLKPMQGFVRLGRQYFDHYLHD